MIFRSIRSGFEKISQALTKSRSFLSKRLQQLFSKKLDAETLQEIEQVLFEADLGVSIIQQLMGHLELYSKKEHSPQELLSLIEQELLAQMGDLDHSFALHNNTPLVTLIVGANGQGKTTSIAKLSHLLKKDNKTVILAGADTFRAGAQEQLGIWADRLKVELVKGAYSADPAAVAFDGVTAAYSRGADVLLIDTAGRLENKSHLMKELEKIRKSCTKARPGTPHETLLVLDATLGQNSLEVAKAFQQATPLTGLILTKLDGSARGGSVIAIQKSLKVPVKFICTGETIEDIQPFEPKTFVHSLLFEAE